MKNLINGVVLGTVIGTSTLFAGDTKITSLGVTSAEFKYDKYIGVKVIDNNGNPLTNGKIQMNPTGKMTMYAMDLSNIDKGEYVVKVRHSKGCEEKKVYNETIYLRAIRTQDTISNNVVGIPVEFDCKDKASSFQFKTENPYKNNTRIEKVFPPLCPVGTVCIKAEQYAYITGKTEKGFDKITISQNGTELGTFSGEIEEKIKLDTSASTKIIFKSDHSIVDKGVTVNLGIF